MGWNSTVYDQDPTRWRPGKFVQIENTWVWSTQNRIGIVWHGISSEDIDARSSNIEKDGEEKHRSETQTAKLWRQKWENWNRGSGYESQGLTLCWKRTRRMLWMESEWTVFERRQVKFPARWTSACKADTKSAPPSEPPTQRGRSASRKKKNLRGWSPSGKFARRPCKVYLKGICTKSPCDSWHSPECHFYKSESGCKFGEKCSFGHRKVIPAK